MPLTAKGRKILTSMRQEYGNKKGESVFYASKNAGKISGVDEEGSPVTSMVPKPFFQDTAKVVRKLQHAKAWDRVRPALMQWRDGMKPLSTLARLKDAVKRGRSTSDAIADCVKGRK